MPHPIAFVDSVQAGDYTAEDGTDLEAAIHISITIPADRRDDVDRNDTTRRELTAILEAAIAASEAD
jgi:5-carboxymethyl-2-hydroxymuconate isomerase